MPFDSSKDFHYSAFVQCFEVKQNPIFSYFAPPSITCIRYDELDISVLKPSTILQSIKSNSDKFGSNYKQYPLLEVNSNTNILPMYMKDAIATKLNVPLDTQIHISKFNFN
jgi:hypothetical protein